MNVVYLEGCQRSGNHILVQWMRGFMDTSCYIDNVCYSLEEQFDNTFAREKSPTAEGAS
jgi:hypothetical protein